MQKDRTQALFGDSPPAPRQPAPYPEGEVIYQCNHRFIVRNGDRVTKYSANPHGMGAGDHPNEAHVMRFAKAHTSIPVPEVFGSDWDRLTMEFIEGETLKEAWPTLTPDQRSDIMTQLEGYISQMRALRGLYLGRLDGQGTVVPSIMTRSGGPFRTVLEFHNWLVHPVEQSVHELSFYLVIPFLSSNPHFEDDKQLGLCLAASKKLFATLHELNARGEETAELGIGFSLFGLRHKSAFDLLNGRAECHIREGADGKTHIRGQTETLGGGGKVRVRPIVQRASCTTRARATHAVLELEIVSRGLLDARRAVVERQSELVPVGKRATDVYLEETTKGIIVTPGSGGGYEKNPNYEIDQARVARAEQTVGNTIASSRFACLGGKTIFVDLAGAEYQTDNVGGGGAPKQSPKERQEGRQINTDLLALKEAMRAWSRSQPRIPFRSSPLTMVLGEHFASPGRKSSSSMVVTVSPARGQYVATLNSLKYANLVGAATA
ncbi:hypothetical protein N3K66_002579 [Trichothecium roseum]|uniref:Uncharacterized protein n=1 Tax=Trichothecium roseum TaxID=47278 RepID=A0ACC0VA07_9HYPO|nr:hypothetical protein N3K66_002579 [Trichothecium roseum]